MSERICCTCLLEDTCKKYGWDDVDHCVNYKPSDYIGDDMCMGHYDSTQSLPVIDDMKQFTLEISGCKKIILKDKSLNFQFELTKGRIEDFDEIIVNGIKFKKIEK